jgi:conjugal transfer pilus assembly protein TraD
VLYDLERYLTEQPRTILVLIVLVMGVVKLPAVLLLALFLTPLSQIAQFPWPVGTVLGLILSGLLYLLTGTSPWSVLEANQMIIVPLIHGFWTPLTEPSLLVCSLPLACVMQSVLLLGIQPKNSMYEKVKRIARGDISEKSVWLSDKKIQKQLNKITSSASPQGSILGVNKATGEPVELTDAAANLHTLVVGTTGCGKTTLLCNIIESVILRGLPLIYVDGKGDLELANRVKSFAEKNGRKCYLFSMVGESVAYNPLATGGITSKKDRIIELREWSEDHYRKIAEGYLQDVLSILQHFNVQIDLVTLANYLNVNNLWDLVREHGDESMNSKIASLAEKKKDIASLVAEIENMANSEIGHLFNCSGKASLHLSKALEENAVIYFCLQPLAFPAYAECLGKLIINDLKSLAASQLRLTEKKKIYAIFDEFSVFSGEQVINLINQGRSAGIHAVLSTQSLSDISKKGGDDLVDQVINNCNNYIIMRQNSHNGSEMLANIVGTVRSYQITSQVSNSSTVSDSGTIRKTMQYILHPDEIKRISKLCFIYFNKINFRCASAQTRSGLHV